MSERYVVMNFDESPVGCGFRQFVIVKATRKKCRLLYLPTGREFTISAETFALSYCTDLKAPRGLKTRIIEARRSRARMLKEKRREREERKQWRKGH